MSDMNNNTQFERTSFFNIQYILTSSVSQLSDIQNIRDELMNPVIHITEPKPLDFTILGCMTITAGFDYFAKYAGPEAVAKIEQKIAEAKINKYKIVAVSCVSPCKSN